MTRRSSFLVRLRGVGLGGSILACLALFGLLNFSAVRRGWGGDGAGWRPVAGLAALRCSRWFLVGFSVGALSPAPDPSLRRFLLGCLGASSGTRSPEDFSVEIVFCLPTVRKKD